MTLMGHITYASSMQIAAMLDLKAPHDTVPQSILLGHIIIRAKPDQASMTEMMLQAEKSENGRRFSVPRTSYNSHAIGLYVNPGIV